jgi:hypothetical protein
MSNPKDKQNIGPDQSPNEENEIENEDQMEGEGAGSHPLGEADPSIKNH